MLRHHVAFYLPKSPSQMVMVEALDFPGAVSQGFDLSDARVMIASALEDLAGLPAGARQTIADAQSEAVAPEADLVQLVPVTV